MSYPYANIVRLASGSGSAKRTMTGKSKQTLITASKDCYIAFNVDSVTAAMGYFIKAGEQYVFNILYPTKIAAIQSSEAGTVSIMEFGDQVLIITEKATFTGNADLVRVGIPTTYTGNSSLMKVIADTFDGKSYMHKTRVATFSGNSTLKKTGIATTFTGNARFAVMHSATFSANASLLKEIAGTFTGGSHFQLE